MQFNGPFVLHAAGSTGTGAGTAIEVAELDSAGAVHRVALDLEVEAVGLTPTVTFQIQGTLDGTVWFSLGSTKYDSDTLSAADIVVTVVSHERRILEIAARPVAQIRVNVSANTNVTFNAKAYELLLED